MPRGMGPTTPPNLPPPPTPTIKRTGVRLFHKSAKSGTLVIIHPTRRYRQPFACPKCEKVHTRKAIHLNLDDQGSVIVSLGVLKELKEAGMPGLAIANEVNNPPPQTLYVGSNPKAFQVEEVDMGKKRLTVIRKKLIGR